MRRATTLSAASSSLDSMMLRDEPILPKSSCANHTQHKPPSSKNQIRIIIQCSFQNNHYQILLIHRPPPPAAGQPAAINVGYLPPRASSLSTAQKHPPKSRHNALSASEELSSTFLLLLPLLVAAPLAKTLDNKVVVLFQNALLIRLNGHPNNHIGTLALLIVQFFKLV